jgi:hypothetical protein
MWQKCRTPTPGTIIAVAMPEPDQAIFGSSPSGQLKFAETIADLIRPHVIGKMSGKSTHQRSHPAPVK